MKIARNSLGMAAVGCALFAAGGLAANLMRAPAAQAANFQAPAPAQMNHWTDKQMDKLKDIHDSLEDAEHHLKEMSPDADSHAGKAIDHLDKAIDEVDREIDEHHHHH